MGYTALDSIRFWTSVLLLLYVAKNIWNVFYIFLIGPLINKVNVKSYGKWALVTGCTNGIGKDYARELAASGCDIILVSKSMEKLKAVAAEIENDFKVKTKVVQVDFSRDVSIYDKLAKEIEGLEIGILVNNVGISYSYPEYFLNLPDWKEFLTKMINVNMVSIIRVTRLILPGMVKRRKGVIINIGSSSALIPFPMISVYAATKAFVSNFSEGIEYEYRNQGILVQCLTPGFIRTTMSKLQTANYFRVNSERYVPKAFSLLGTTTKTHGCFLLALFGLLWGFMSKIFEKFIVWVTIRIHERYRKMLLKQYNKSK